MPCGGITHIEDIKFPCFHCGEEDTMCDHEVIEWDAVIHGKCIADFLRTEEGRAIYEHGHHLYARIDGETFIIRTHQRQCMLCKRMFKPSLDKVIDCVNKRRSFDPSTCEECK